MPCITGEETSHISDFDLVSGEVTVQVPDYFGRNASTPTCLSRSHPDLFQSDTTRMTVSGMPLNMPAYLYGYAHL